MSQAKKDGAVLEIEDHVIQGCAAEFHTLLPPVQLAIHAKMSLQLQMEITNLNALMVKRLLLQSSLLQLQL